MHSIAQDMVWAYLLAYLSCRNSGIALLMLDAIMIESMK